MRDRAFSSSDSLFARFDDLLTGGPALGFRNPTDVLRAETPNEVPETLLAVEAAAFHGQWAVGFVAYEAAAGLSSLPVSGTVSRGPAVPSAWFALFEDFVELPSLDQEPSVEHFATPWELGVDRPSYLAAIAEIREAIAAGNTYQCNFTMPLRSRVDGDLRGLYRSMALAQRSAYCTYIDTGDLVIASASPELFFDWRDGWLTTRPMKGTARRGRTIAEDEQRSGELRASPKERAENLMIVDLLRNDLGRIASFGTVEVPDLFAVERYEGLWQMTSTVRAQPRPEVGLVDLFRALFPSGSVTGAPKHRTMGLIAELEQARRGLYCGAIGVLAPAGLPFRARFSVAIRTVVADRRSGEAVFGAGGGITWGSDPEAEFNELLAKTEVLAAESEPFALFETTTYEPGSGLRHGEAHLARLGESAAYFGFNLDRGALDARILNELGHLDAAVRVRLSLQRDGTFAIETSPLPEAIGRPVLLGIDTEPVESSDRFLFHKTTRRRSLARRLACHPGADDLVLVNERGEVTETTIANLAVRLDGRWWTPPTNAGLLPGVERARRLRSGELGERRLSVADLESAEALAVLSSLRGWRDAELLDEALWDRRDRMPARALSR